MELASASPTRASQTAPFAAANGYAGFAEVPGLCDRGADRSAIDGCLKMSCSETKPQTGREPELACQCNRCAGTGKCPTCSGTGEVERSELRNFRATRQDRLYSPAPQLRGVWRYQTPLAAKTEARDRADGDNMTVADGQRANPKCADETIWPCSAENWRPCDGCQKLTCERHDYLVPVLPPSPICCDLPDMICKECLAALWYRGDIFQTSRTQYSY
jgi:hypothetical protein